jgi:hypothetical protein
MRSFRFASTAALAAIAVGCSQTEPAREPIVVTKQIPIEVPPEARKPCPALSPKPDRDMPEAEVFDNWASDRTARNICEIRRAKAIAAIDVGAKPQ